MKKLIFFGVFLIFAASAAGGGWFAWKNLRGIGPSLREPSRDITMLLPPAAMVQGELPTAINTTGMPLALPPGFFISIFAKDLGKPRVLARGPSGELLVSIPEQGRVVALPDRNGDGVADETRDVIEGLSRPHGLAFRCPSTSLGTDNGECELFIAESHRVAAYAYNRTNFRASVKRTVAELPDGGNHWSRTILFSPDGNLFVSVGSSCNVCGERDWRRAKILSVDPDGGTLRTFASGLRNAVFMALHPATGALWATEMGRDLLGDDLPPDEINIIKEGKDYGWPFCFGKQTADPFGRHPKGCSTTVSSFIDLPAHSAPLGLVFVPEDPPAGGWPEDWWYDMLLAYHGSWNRSVPTGYKVVRFRLDAQGNPEGADSTGSPQAEDFISGWLQSDGTALGRPVDILVQPGGLMYISDDKAGVIYRVMYRGLQ